MYTQLSLNFQEPENRCLINLFSICTWDANVIRRHVYTLGQCWVKPSSYFLRMRIRIKFWIHRAVFAAKVSQELSTSQLMKIIHCKFGTSKLVSHSQEVCPGLYPPGLYPSTSKLVTNHYRLNPQLSDTSTPSNSNVKSTATMCECAANTVISASSYFKTLSEKWAHGWNSRKLNLSSQQFGGTFGALL